MAIKPIDLQVAMGQMPEVAKGEQGRSAAAAEMQQTLAGESGQKSREAPNRLEENKKTEHAIITGEEKKGGGRREGKKGGGENKEKRGTKVRDEKLGLFIDVLK